MRGPAPIAIDRLRPGKRSVSAQLENFETTKQEVQVELHKTTRITVTLKPVLGSISISSTEDVRCMVAGQSINIVRAGAEIVQAPLGRQVVTCEGDSVEPVSAEADVKVNRTAEIRLTPRARAKGVEMQIDAPDNTNKWEVRGPTGSVCLLPCKLEIADESGLWIQRSTDRTDEKPARIPIPDHIPFNAGTQVQVRPHFGTSGGGFLLGATLLMGVGGKLFGGLVTSLALGKSASGAEILGISGLCAVGFAVPFFLHDYDGDRFGMQSTGRSSDAAQRVRFHFAAGPKYAGAKIRF